MNIFRLINLFRKTNGRSPTPSELAKLKQQAEEIATQDNVLQFPQGGKDRLSPFDDFKASEDIYEQAQNLTPIAAMKEANNLIGRKGKYKNISAEDAKKKLGELEEIIKSEKLEPEDLVGDDLGDMLNDYDGDPDAMAMGGLAGLLGEEPRSEYGAGGGTGAPPITYNDNVDKSGPGPTMPPNTMMNTPAIDPRMLNQGRGSGIFIDPRGLQNGKIPLPTQSLADGGRIGFKEGGPPNPGRRNFMKLMAGLASIPVLGKFFKGAKVAKVASKVVPLKNTTTTMPAWFPDLVDKFVAKGVRNKIDEDMIEYTVKELPDVKMIEKTDGMISVEGKNAYNEDYFIQYEPPGYTVVDEKTGKAVKTPGEFVATDTEYRMVSPEDYDIDGVNVENIDEILGGSSNQLEGFAKGTGKTKNTIGQKRIDEADARGASSTDESLRADINDPYKDVDPTDFVEPEDFASGGLAKLLGE